MNGSGGSDFLHRLVRKMTVFMQDRYGIDQLYRALLVVWLSFTIISSVIGHFCRSPLPSMILMGVSLVSAALMIFRALSKNRTKRMEENMKYLKLEGNVRKEFRLLAARIRDRKTSRYRKCPKCKTVMRVKKEKGKHTVHCPVCGKNFQTYIRI